MNKITGDEPAMPIQSLQQSGEQRIDVDFNYLEDGTPGLTIRQHFAALAMQGIYGKISLDFMDVRHMDVRHVAECAVDAADALINELNKNRPYL